MIRLSNIRRSDGDDIFKNIGQELLDAVLKQGAPQLQSVTHVEKACWLWYQKENNWLEQVHSERFPECWFVVLVGKQEKMVITGGVKPEVG